jgi:hypothetical protein
MVPLKKNLQYKQLYIPCVPGYTGGQAEWKEFVSIAPSLLMAATMATANALDSTHAYL